MYVADDRAKLVEELNLKVNVLADELESQNQKWDYLSKVAYTVSRVRGG